ncbi:MYXO-CTERM sorting domain-containing protein [Thiohalocapsa halophila]|nr:MYXO-CTERM sorting domain-containing protein [Thiohalocapsa halophila]
MPNPTTPLLTLLGLGAMGVAAYRRRREEGLKRRAAESA